jgi:hypothetical protein
MLTPIYFLFWAQFNHLSNISGCPQKPVSTTFKNNAFCAVLVYRMCDRRPIQWTQLRFTTRPSLHADICTKFAVSQCSSPLNRLAPEFYISGRPTRPRTQHECHHDTKVKPEAATAVIELLLMGGKTPETCWVVNKRQDNKLKNCCIRLAIYLNCTMMHGLTILKFYI